MNDDTLKQFDDGDLEDDAQRHRSEPGPRPAASGSALASLRARREQAKDDLHLDLAVPRLDPPVYVRFAPVEQALIDRANKRHEKSKAQDKNVVINAVILADACQGVFEVIDGEEVSVDDRDRDGEWPRFDEQLADLLGVDATKAADVVRALYLTDGDVIATATKLADWSGYSLADLEERAEGN
jgi:hypothetical protein